ncbi:MAG: Type II secretion system protein D precursor [Syntrophus sp. PtaB.Bin001]|nr:MAG: Type II secretion system protein D precursor [Syntrophus sp. PtaB.Bin001]
MVPCPVLKLHSAASFLTALLLSLLVALPCQATGPERVIVNTMRPQKLTLTVGKSIIVECPQPLKRVSIAAPEVAELLTLTTRQIYLTGKGPGSTNLTLWKTDNTIMAVYDLEVLPDLVGLKEKIHQLMPEEDGVRVTASPDGINLSGTVSSLTNMNQILSLANSYAPKQKDGKPTAVLNLMEVGSVNQVMLEVRVSEMSRSLIKRMGVNFSYLSDGGKTFGLTLLDNLTTTNTATIVPNTPNALDLGISSSVTSILHFLGGGATWTVFIDALKEQGLLKVLAEPTLIALSGKTANFLAGGEFPIPVPQSGTTNTITIEYKTYGVGLNFTPTVLSNKRISMLVAPEVSDLDFTNSIVLQGFEIPAITTRRVATNVELADGQSFAIAGLLKDDVRQIVRKIPLLGDIPVLGTLFRSSQFRKNETELVIIVTPHLVKPLNMAKQTLPTDQFIEPNDFEFYLMGNPEGRFGSPAGGNATAPASSALPADKTGGIDGDYGYIRP